MAILKPSNTANFISSSSSPSSASSTRHCRSCVASLHVKYHSSRDARVSCKFVTDPTTTRPGDDVIDDQKVGHRFMRPRDIDDKQQCTEIHRAPEENSTPYGEEV